MALKWSMYIMYRASHYEWKCKLSFSLLLILLCSRTDELFHSGAFCTCTSVPYTYEVTLGNKNVNTISLLRWRAKNYIFQFSLNKELIYSNFPWIRIFPQIDLSLRSLLCLSNWVSYMYEKITEQRNVKLKLITRAEILKFFCHRLLKHERK